jgi:uncharacterized membrane protein
MDPREARKNALRTHLIDRANHAVLLNVALIAQMLSSAALGLTIRLIETT